MSDKKDKIFELLNYMAVSYGRSETRERLSIYTKSLSEFSIEEVEESIRWHSENSKFFPALCELRQRIRPIQKVLPDDAATEMASAILTAAQDYGQDGFEAAKRELGQVAWLSVIRCGGWNDLCAITHDQVPTTRAQLRGVCKSMIAVAERDPDQCKFEYQRIAQRDMSAAKRSEGLKLVKWGL